jgi:hypothetical protein
MTDWKSKYKELAKAVRDDLRYETCDHDTLDPCCTKCRLDQLSYPVEAGDLSDD